MKVFDELASKPKHEMISHIAVFDAEGKSYDKAAPYESVMFELEELLQ